MRSAPPFRSVCQLTGDVADRPTKFFALLDGLAAADAQRATAGTDDVVRLQQENESLRRSCNEWAELALLLVERIDELSHQEVTS